MNGHASGQAVGIASALWQVLARHRLRIGAALILLLLAKLATVVVPLLLKRIIDTFQGGSAGALPPTLPVLLLAGYAVLRFSSTLFNELRDLLFSRVTLDAVSGCAQRTFSHLHALGPHFHARRSPGSLLPDIDRGTGGIAFLLGVALFTIVPTLVEIGLVPAIMLRAYEAGRPTLVDVDLRLAPGTTLAVVGRSGSGKSTLARLLLRYYAPGSGRILVDGQDIGQAEVGSVRRAIGVVPQETALFNDSIGNNIAYRRPGCSRDEVIAACRAALVHDMIAALPDSYDTQVGERGARLSGGERQRIAIAHHIQGPLHPGLRRSDFGTGRGVRARHHRGTEPAGATAPRWWWRTGCRPSCTRTRSW